MWLHTPQSAGEPSSGSSSPRFIGAVPTALDFGATPGASQSDSSSHQAHLQDAASTASSQLLSDSSSVSGNGHESQPGIVFQPSAPRPLQLPLQPPLPTGSLHGSPDQVSEGAQRAQQLRRKPGRSQGVQEAHDRRWEQAGRAPHPGAPISAAPGAARLESWTTYSDGDVSEKDPSPHGVPVNSTPAAAPAPESNVETRGGVPAEAAAAAAQLWGRQPVQRMQPPAAASAPSALDELPRSQVKYIRQSFHKQPSAQAQSGTHYRIAASRCCVRHITAYYGILRNTCMRVTDTRRRQVLGPGSSAGRVDPLTLNCPAAWRRRRGGFRHSRQRRAQGPALAHLVHAARQLAAAAAAGVLRRLRCSGGSFAAAGAGAGGN